MFGAITLLLLFITDVVRGSVSAPLRETVHRFLARGVHALTSEQAMLKMLGVPELIADDFKDCRAIDLLVAAETMHRKAMKERLLANRVELFGRGGAATCT